MDKVKEIVKLIENRKNIAKKDADNSYSDMEYDRAIGVYHELGEILDDIEKIL